MDKLTFYKEKMHAFVVEYAAKAVPRPEGTEVYAVTDDIHGHYMLFHSSWGKSRRNYGCFLHVRIKNEKIYIESDGTDFGFSYIFAEQGIPKEDIVLAFHPENVRQYSEFGIV